MLFYSYHIRRKRKIGKLKKCFSKFLCYIDLTVKYLSNKVQIKILIVCFFVPFNQVDFKILPWTLVIQALFALSFCIPSVKGWSRIFV